MENPAQGKHKWNKRDKLIIVLQWISINFVGWIITAFLWHRLNTTYILLGLWVGILQGAYLRKWNIRFFHWVLATSIGYGIPLVIYEIKNIDWLYIMDYDRLIFVFYPVYILFSSTFLGLLQYLVLKKNINRSLFWILCVQIGFLFWLLALHGEVYVLEEMARDMPGYGRGVFDAIMGYVTIRMTPWISFVPSIFTGLFLARNKKVEVEVVAEEEVLLPEGVD